MAAENNFPTIRDLLNTLSELVEHGVGDLPIQIVVAPDSTIQALAQVSGGDTGKPAVMIEFPRNGQALGVPFISTDRLTQGGGMPSLLRQ